MKKNLKLLWIVFDTIIKPTGHYISLQKQFPYNALSLIENFLMSDYQIEFITKVYIYQQSQKIQWAEKQDFDCLQISFIGNDQQAILNQAIIVTLVETKQEIENRKPFFNHNNVLVQYFKMDLTNQYDEYVVVLSLKSSQIEFQQTYQKWNMYSDARERQITVEFNNQTFILTFLYVQFSLKIQVNNGKIVRAQQLSKDGKIKGIRDFQTNQLWSQKIAGQLDESLTPKGFVSSQQFDGYAKNKDDRQGVVFYTDLIKQHVVYVKLNNNLKQYQQFFIPNQTQWISYQQNVAQGIKYNYTEKGITYFGDLDCIGAPQSIPNGHGMIKTKQGLFKQVQAKQNAYIEIFTSALKIEFIQVGTQLNKNNRVAISLVQIMDHISYSFNCFQYSIHQSNIDSVDIQNIISLIEQKSKISKYVIASIGNTACALEYLLQTINHKLSSYENIFISLQQEAIKTKSYKHQLFYMKYSQYLFKSMYMQVHIKILQKQKGFRLEGKINNKIIYGSISQQWNVHKDSVQVITTKSQC